MGSVVWCQLVKYDVKTEKDKTRVTFQIATIFQLFRLEYPHLSWANANNIPYHLNCAKEQGPIVLEGITKKTKTFWISLKLKDIN